MLLIINWKRPLALKSIVIHLIYDGDDNYDCLGHGKSNYNDDDGDDDVRRS